MFCGKKCRVWNAALRASTKYKLPSAARLINIVSMNESLNIRDFHRRMVDFKPERFHLSRCLACYSAAVAIADEELMTLAISRGRQFGVTRDQFYEVILQSYLFLGFPRMLLAAENLNLIMPNQTERTETAPSVERDYHTWYEDGERLCQRIYGDAFESLKTKVQPMAPEVFDWMILEGYGKVLSRPGLDIDIRELSIVAFLIAENRPKQLWSHMKGAINVGVSIEHLRVVVADLGEAVGDGFRSATAIIERLSR